MPNRILPPAWLALFAHDVPPATGAPSTPAVTPPTTPPADPAPPAAPPGTPPAPAATAKPEDALGDPGKAALQAERKARAEAEKQATALAAKVKGFEDAQKTAEQKLVDDLAAEKARADKATADLLRMQVASSVGIPSDLADLISGADEAAMRATAERLKAHMAPGTTPPAPPSASGTTNGGTPPAPTDFRKATDAEVDAELRKHGVATYR